MDLVRQLRDVRFDMAVRGYDCAGVDTFLATLRGEVTELQERHAEAQNRISELEAGSGSTPQDAETSDTEGTLRRTLVLAQRLADETEVEAKAAAAEMIESATNDAATLRSDAEADATRLRQEGEEELNAANTEARSIRETVSAEAEESRSNARDSAFSLLASAESTGAERVKEIEALAHEEAEARRVPIREEVEQLEQVRSQLLVDISDLEAHLEAQRVRVRTAVEALRVGMSGSIQDLEAVADDDTLMAPDPAPAHSRATGADVAVAPEVEIVEAVDQQAQATAPEVAALEAHVDETMAAKAAESELVEVAESDDVESVDVESVDVESDDVDGDGGWVGVHGEAGAHAAEMSVGVETEPIPVVDAPEPPIVDSAIDDTAPLAEPATVESDAAEVYDHEVDPEDGGQSAEEAAFAVLSGAAVGGAVGGAALADDGIDDPADLVEVDAEPALATADDLEEAELVVLDEEPTALFGTEPGADAEIAEVEESEPAPAPADVAATGGSFVGAFAEALDQLPIDN